MSFSVKRFKTYTEKISSDQGRVLQRVVTLAKPLQSYFYCISLALNYILKRTALNGLSKSRNQSKTSSYLNQPGIIQVMT